LNDNYKIELDLFSGQQNPSFQITRNEFESILNEINKLEESEPIQLFDGLGFRGIVLSGMSSVSIHIQNRVIKVQTSEDVKFYKSNPQINLKAIDIFKTHDIDGKCKLIIDKVINEYL